MIARLFTRVNICFTSVSLNDSSYYFNPCKTFNFPVNVDPHTVKGEQCHNVLGCKRIERQQNDSEYHTVAIRMNSMVLPQKALLTTRYYGSKYESVIVLEVRTGCPCLDLMQIKR